MRISMIGSGYVGLVSGACFADFGHQVVCVDNNPNKIEALNNGEIPIFEPGLETLVKRNVENGRLSFTTELGPSVRDADVVFIAVGTPSRRGSGRADLSSVFAAAREIGEHAEGFTVVVDKSTVPVGTADKVAAILAEVQPDGDFAVCSNPEFLREGAAIRDFKHPDRIIVGVEDDRAQAVMEEVYRPLHLNKGPLMFTDRRTAELIKYAANAFLSTKITFINEIANLCEAVGADVQQVARGIGLDNRIGPKFLNAGPGYGGSCFPKDTLALAQTARDEGVPFQIVETVIKVNAERKLQMAQKVIDIFEALDGVQGKTLAILGVTFKPNTDDMRDAPSLSILPVLHQAGITLHLHDPQHLHIDPTLLPPATWFDSPYDALAGVDGVVIITEWESFRALDLERVRALMRGNVIIDLRNIYRPETMREYGFDYTAVGVGSKGSGSR